MRILSYKMSISPNFDVIADSLESGDYYCVAYAKNGMGVSYGDTVIFVVR